MKVVCPSCGHHFTLKQNERKKTVRCLSHSEQQVSDLIGADPREIIFTSGATESNNMAIKVLPSVPTLCHYFSIPSRSSTLVSFRV